MVGYFAPRTLGVGYDNIDDILSGRLALAALVSLSLLKFISWSIALGSGTSGGTLAPLFTRTAPSARPPITWSPRGWAGSLSCPGTRPARCSGC
ncbi:chloride channel protein [Sorangium sp. So ce269]